MWCLPFDELRVDPAPELFALLAPDAFFTTGVSDSALGKMEIKVVRVVCWGKPETRVLGVLLGKKVHPLVRFAIGAGDAFAGVLPGADLHGIVAHDEGFGELVLPVANLRSLRDPGRARVRNEGDLPLLERLAFERDLSAHGDRRLPTAADGRQNDQNRRQPGPRVLYEPAHVTAP